MRNSRRWFVTIVAAVAAAQLTYGNLFAQEHAPTAPAAAQPEANHDATAHPGGQQQELAHGNASKSLEDAAEFKTDLSIYTLVVFLLLLAILSRFAWPPIAKGLEAREKYIAEQIAAAAATHEQAKRLLAEHEARLAATAGDVRAMLEEAKRDAEHTRKQGEAEGRKAKEEELARALLEIKRAKDAAVHDLATASANVAIDLARKVIQQKITPDEHTTVVREALNRLAPQPSKN
jgi:F-type H+-transporting ATPase subunit b